MNPAMINMCRAICSAQGLNPDAVVLPSPPAVTGVFQWQQFVPAAQAMLAQIYTPTPAMLGAVTTSSATPTQVWQAMMSVVLS